MLVPGKATAIYDSLRQSLGDRVSASPWAIGCAPNAPGKDAALQLSVLHVLQTLKTWNPSRSMSPDKHTVKASKGVIGRNSSLWLYRWQPTISSKPSTEIWELRLFSCYFLYFFVFRFFCAYRIRTLQGDHTWLIFTGVFRCLDTFGFFRLDRVFKAPNLQGSANVVASSFTAGLVHHWVFCFNLQKTFRVQPQVFTLPEPFEHFRSIPSSPCHLRWVGQHFFPASVFSSLFSYVCTISWQYMISTCVPWLIPVQSAKNRMASQKPDPETGKLPCADIMSLNAHSS